MTTIQKQAAEKAIALLNASGAQYKVIFTDGTEYGDLEIVTQKKHKRRVRIPYGTLQGLYKERVHETNVGGVIQIPIADATALGGNAASLRSAATAYASNVWGNNTYMSTITDKHVEILRIA